MASRDSWATQITAQLLVVAGSVLLGHGQESARLAPLSTDTIVERLMTSKSRQLRQLDALMVVLAYRVDYQGFGGARHAEMRVVSTYVSPNKKNFRILSESGSRFLLEHILNKLLESEREYQFDEADSDLSPRNYQFKLLGSERVAGNVVCDGDYPAQENQIPVLRKDLGQCSGLCHCALGRRTRQKSLLLD